MTSASEWYKAHLAGKKIELSPSEVYAYLLSGRETHSVHRPYIPDGGMYLFEGCDNFHITKEGQLETVDGRKVPFTGNLCWYVGMGITLTGVFRQGFIYEVGENNVGK